MGVIIIIAIVIIIIKLGCEAYGKHVADKIVKKWEEQEATNPPSRGKPLPTPTDCREMIYQFFDIVRELNNKAPYMASHPHRLNMYGGGEDNMHLHIEYDKDWQGIDNIVRDQLGYELPRTKPDGGGWYSDGRYLCFDSENLNGGFTWACNCMRNEGALTADLKRIVESYFPNFRYKSFSSSYLVDYYSFLVIGEG